MRSGRGLRVALEGICNKHYKRFKWFTKGTTKTRYFYHGVEVG